MTIKELKKVFPQDKYEWRGVDVNNATNNNYTEDDILDMVKFKPSTREVFVYWEAKPKPTLSKEKLDQLIQLNRQFFKTRLLGCEKTWEELNKAKVSCGEEIYDTGLLDVIPSIVRSTRAYDTPNETIYKVFEALGYEVK